MEITPQVLEDVKFTTRARGYDRDEVDEFLERVGAGVAQVQNRLRDEARRADAAEARASALGNRSEAEETLKRTLVLAQRTADAAVAEANETAARTVSEAEARAARLIADAEAQAATLRTEAESEARRVIESTRAPLVEEIKELEQLRNFLHDDIQLLEGHLASQRERLRAQVADLQRLIDDPGMLEIEPTPETSGVDPAPSLPPPVEPQPTAPAPPTLAEPPIAFVSPAPVAAPAPAPAAEAEPSPSASVWPDLNEQPRNEPPRSDQHWTEQSRSEQPRSDQHWSEPRGDDRPAEAPPTDTGEAPSWAPSPEFRASHEYELPPFDSSAFDRLDEGPPTQEVRSLADLESGGDSFLDQLRRAVDDDRDEDSAMTAFFDQDEDDRPRSRFGRRR
jgi:cell division initiation protein